ncbi:MAG TPA: HEAT repeat domain-containing protein [Ktedonobacteraceae bacterium]|nr:HEAT repeat domain-containing protein [Ktedonobacteraceae bacterium]
MSQYINTSQLHYQARMMNFLHTILQHIRKLPTRFEPVPVSELMVQATEASISTQLTQAVNDIQEQLWRLPKQEQMTLRMHLMTVLSDHVLHASERSLRLEAARWLRLLVQTGLITQPATVFVTLVTAASSSTEIEERRAYLKLLFECFWPFRHPYPAYSWEDFPTNDVFYPLASLFASANLQTQEALVAIFTELPALNDAEISDALLPIALRWANHADPEYRRRSTDILARMSHPQAQEALQCLLTDPDPTVRASARRAASYTQPA